MKPATTFISAQSSALRWFAMSLFLAGLCFVLLVDAGQRPQIYAAGVSMAIMGGVACLLLVGLQFWASDVEAVQPRGSQKSRNPRRFNAGVSDLSFIDGDGGGD